MVIVRFDTTLLRIVAIPACMLANRRAKLEQENIYNFYLPKTSLEVACAGDMKLCLFISIILCHLRLPAFKDMKYFASFTIYYDMLLFGQALMSLCM